MREFGIGRAIVQTTIKRITDTGTPVFTIIPRASKKNFARGMLESLTPL